MANLRDDDPGPWLNTGSHSFCPACGSPQVKVRQALICKPLGTFSLAGMQMKSTGTWGWQYRCFACGDEGPCEIRQGINATAVRQWEGWSPG